MRLRKPPLLILIACLASGTALAKTPTPKKAVSAPVEAAELSITVSGADKIWLQNIINKEVNGVAAIVALKAILPQNFHVFATKSIELGLVVTWNQGTTQDVLQQIMGQLKAYYVLPGDGSITLYPGKQPIAKVHAPKKVKEQAQEPAVDEEQLQKNKELIEKIRGRIHAP